MKRKDIFFFGALALCVAAIWMDALLLGAGPAQELRLLAYQGATASAMAIAILIRPFWRWLNAD